MKRKKTENQDIVDKKMIQHQLVQIISNWEKVFITFLVIK